MSETKLEIKVSADTGAADAALKALSRTAEDVAGATGAVKVNADTGVAQEALQELSRTAEDVDGATGAVKVEADTGAAQSALQELSRTAEEVSETGGDMKVSADTKAVQSALSGLLDTTRRIADTLSRIDGTGLERVAEAGRKAQRSLDGVTSSARKMVSSIAGGITGKLKGAISSVPGMLSSAFKAGFASVTAALGAATFACVKFGAAQEQTRLKFQVLLGDVAKGNKLFSQLVKFANVTPFSTDDVVKAGQTLLSFGVAAGDVQDTLKAVGNAAAATGVNVADMAAIYGKAMVKGKVEAETLNQMSERGVPIIKALAKQMGVAEKEVYKLTSKGKIGADDLRKAFFSLSEKGGAYNGMMEKQARTVGGLWSTLLGKVQNVAATLGEQLMPVMQKCLDKAIELADALGRMVASGDFAKGLADGIAAAAPMVASVLKWVVRSFLGIKGVIHSIIGTVFGLVNMAVGGVIGLLTACFKLGVDLGAAIFGGGQWVLGKLLKLVDGFIGTVMGWVRSLVQGIIDGVLWAYNKVASVLHMDHVEIELGDWGGKAKEGTRLMGDSFLEASQDTFNARNKIYDMVRPVDAFAAELGVGQGLMKIKDGMAATYEGGKAADAFDKMVDGVAGKITGWARGFGNDVKANAKKQAEEAGKATLDKAKPEAKVKDIVGDRGITRKVDSLAKIGLFNFGKSAEQNLDLRRNNLLEAIRNGIDRLAAGGRGGQAAAMPALGSV